MELNRLIISVNDASNNMNGHDNRLLHPSPGHLSLPSLPPSVTSSVSGISDTSEGNSSVAESDFCAFFDQTDTKTPETQEKSDYHYKIPIAPILLPKYASTMQFSPIEASTLSTTLSDSDCESLYEKNEISGGNVESVTESPSIITSSLMSPSVNTELSCVVSPSVGNNSIAFDIASGQHSISSKGLELGYHEFTIKVIDCDSSRQEIGVVSNLAGCMDDNVAASSISDNDNFGARAVYGSEPKTKTFYYSSHNKDNTCRCKKNLSALSSLWKNDEITVCLDLDKGTIVFMLNGKKVRKSISVQRNVIYYPIISFSGDCRYQVV